VQLRIDQYELVSIEFGRRGVVFMEFVVVVALHYLSTIQICRNIAAWEMASRPRETGSI